MPHLIARACRALPLRNPSWMRPMPGPSIIIACAPSSAAALLHNMSVPSRTEVRAEKRGIADRIVVFSLVHALIARGVLEAPEEPEKLPKGKDIQDLQQDNSGDPRVTVRARWPSPGDLFVQPSKFRLSGLLTRRPCLTSGPTFVTLGLWKRTLSASDSGPAPRRAKRHFLSVLRT